VIYEYRDRFSDRFITASARHNGIQIRAVGQQAIDTISPAGRMMLQMPVRLLSSSQGLGSNLNYPINTYVDY